MKVQVEYLTCLEAEMQMSVGTKVGKINQKADANPAITGCIRKVQIAKAEAERSYADAITQWCKEITKRYAELEKMREQKDKEGVNRCEIGCEPESPIDWEKTQLVPKPLSFDTMDFDCKYFRCESNKESQRATSEQIATFVDGATEFGCGSSGVSGSGGHKAAKAATTQSECHTLDGHVVFVCRATHRNATVMSPTVWDAEKAVIGWNAKFPDDQLPRWNGTPEVRTQLMHVVNGGKNDKAGKDDKGGKGGAPKLTVLTGYTVGSSFVGMVHVQKQEETHTRQQTDSKISEMKAEAHMSSLFGAVTGHLGGGHSSSDQSASKNCLSTSKLSSNCTVISRGLIPSIKSHEMSTMVKSLKPSPQDTMKQLAAIAGGGGGDGGDSGDTTKRANSFCAMNSSHLKDVVSETAKIEDKKNKIIDMNSMMEALDDYVQQARNAIGGVPINFYLSFLEKKQVAKLMLDKYCPDWNKNLWEDDEKASKKAKTK